MTNIHKLENGITVLFSPNKNADTACVVVGVSVGSNNEEESEHGLAHFFEHMCFKGTSNYPENKDLLIRMDEAGLVGNAFTGREKTAYFLSGRKEKINDMIDITSDIFLNSLFDAEEMEKEKGVILEEIAMYEYDPSSRSDDEVSRALFNGSVMEHDILGTRESVKSFSRDDFVNFFKKHYTGSNTIISIAGNFSEEEVLEKLKNIYSKVEAGKKTKKPDINIKGISKKYQTVVRKDINQAHISIGFHSPTWMSKDKHALALLSTLFGGSMSSRLFLNIRESLGLCYTIRSSTYLGSNFGVFSIYAGANIDKIPEAMKEISNECNIIKNEKVSESELKKAKEYALGKKAMKSETSSSVAIQNINFYASTDLIETEEEYKKNIMKVTAEDIQRLAKEIFSPDNMSICYVTNKEVPAEISENFLKE